MTEESLCKISKNPHQLVLIDEVDALLLDKPYKTIKNVLGNQFVGFTATPGKTNVEKCLLKKMGVPVLQSNMENPPSLTKNCEKLTTMGVKQVIDSYKGPVLAIGEFFAVDWYKRMFPGRVQEWHQDGWLEPKKDGTWPIVIVTDANLRRAGDFRCDGQVLLVLSASFSSQRDFEQACGRAGRYVDKCRRIRTVDEVDEAKQATLKKLMATNYEQFNEQE